MLFPVHNMLRINISDLHETFGVKFNFFPFCWFLVLQIRFDRVVKLAPLPIGAVKIREKVFALLCTIIRWDVLFLQ